MTSSYVPPGGTKMAMFWAPLESDDDPGKDETPPDVGDNGKQWVLLDAPSQPGFRIPLPPKRPADYAGQIVAVPMEPDSLQMEAVALGEDLPAPVT